MSFLRANQPYKFHLLGTTERNPSAIIDNLRVLYQHIPSQVVDAIERDTSLVLSMKDLDTSIRASVSEGKYDMLKFLGISVLRPKIAKRDKADILADVQRWTSRKNISNPDYLPELKPIVEGVVDELFAVSHKPEYSLEEWFEKYPDKWATAGSGGYVKGIKGRKKIYTWIDGTWSLDKIMRQQPISRVAIKPEPGKARLIVTGDLGLQILMTYVEDNLSMSRLQSIKGSGITSEQLAMWRKRNIDLFKQGKIALSLDQSEFDHNISKAEIAMCIEALCKQANLHDFYFKIMARIQNSYIEYDGVRLRWNGGMMSGWKWTNLVESILSIAIVRWMATKIGPVYNEIASGDDVAFFVDHKSWLDRAVELGKTIHKTIHLQKSYPSQHNLEFLRQIYTRDGRILRYPLRALRPLIFRDKVEKPDTRERAEMWRKYIHRCDRSWYNPLLLANTIAVDLWGLNKGRVSKRTILNAMETPIKSGGLGLLHFGASKGTKIIKQNKTTDLPNYRRKMSPLVERLLSDKLAVGYVEYYQPTQIEYAKKWYTLAGVPGLKPGHRGFEPFEFQAKVMYGRLEPGDAIVVNNPGWTIREAQKALQLPSDIVVEDQVLMDFVRRTSITTDLAIPDTTIVSWIRSQLSVTDILY